MSWPYLLITQSHRLPSSCPYLFLHVDCEEKHLFLFYSALTLPSQLIIISFWYLTGWPCLYKDASCNMTRDPLVPHQGQRAEGKVANTGNSWLVTGNSIPCLEASHIPTLHRWVNALFSFDRHFNGNTTTGEKWVWQDQQESVILAVLTKGQQWMEIFPDAPGAFRVRCLRRRPQMRASVAELQKTLTCPVIGTTLRCFAILVTETDKRLFICPECSQFSQKKQIQRNLALGNLVNLLENWSQ